ncbi:hypothetical protein [Oceanobacillus timonensis]|uniref:hypothetical protein n=1 Tax=Oceanobacillus timonensis TaxID=1926285 RepID=UPI0015C47AEE|nr:hypothetical protein [Oceanobacillus timonensis]
MIGFLTNAIEQKNKVMIYYMDQDYNVTQRIIRVVGIDDKKILGYCYYRKQVRSFKLENILSFGQLKEVRGHDEVDKKINRTNLPIFTVG